MHIYGSETKLDIVGCFEAELQAGKKKVQTTIYVSKEKSRHPLLSEASGEALGLVKYNDKFKVKQVEQKTIKGTERRKQIEEILEKNQEVFSGKIGKFKGNKVTLMIDETVQPIVQKCRPIPDNLRAKAEDKIETLIDNDIIEDAPVDIPRTWVSPPHIEPKPGEEDIRFCIDMRMASMAILRPYVQLPTVTDITSKFQGCNKYSKIDLKEAYHQFELDEKSRNITTFYGPSGLMRYKRLNYGTKSAQDHMQIELGKCLAGIPMQVNISDDIMIGGRNEEEHDEALERVLERLRENGLTVKKEKCIFDAEEVTFAGLVISKDGIRPSEKNVRNLKQATKPTNKAELRSFLGLATYSERFIPKFASIVAPLRELIKGKDKKWKWEDKHETAYDEVKEALSKDALLHHYVVGRETELVVDMSDKGLGAVLLQRASKREPYRPVVYKSRSLKDPETRYSATEREALAIRWAVKKLYRYLVGAPRFKIVTDHCPLRFMFHKKCGDIPPRIEKFIMDIHEYEGPPPG